MESKTLNEFLEKQLPQRFNPEKAKGIDVVAQLVVTGKAESWVITVKNQQLQVSKGTASSPNLTIKASEKDFMDMLNRKLSPEQAFFTGKIQFEGSLSLALKLRDAGFF